MAPILARQTTQHSSRQGLVIVDDDDLERLKEVAGRTGEAPFTAKMVPVEELLQKDLDQWGFLERLEDSTNRNPEDFTIPPDRAGPGVPGGARTTVEMRLATRTQRWHGSPLLPACNYASYTQGGYKGPRL